ncbi:MAG: hypothetical protein RIF36_06985, partial [Imperialibacter sp.]|uniref:hypothetical protein n=1 Tax=Imperialibacter sp. TaxID=2038411 RepID=UPI0032EC5F21
MGKQKYTKWRELRSKAFRSPGQMHLKLFSFEILPFYPDPKGKGEFQSCFTLKGRGRKTALII